MNRIFKVVWNSAVGNWVVTSELSKKKAKNKRSITLKIGVLSSAILSATLSPSLANTDCSINPGGTLENVTCTTPIVKSGGTGVYSFNNVKFELEGQHEPINTGGVFVSGRNDDVGKNIDLIFDSLTMNNALGQTSGVVAESYGKNSDSIIQFTGVNNITLGGYTNTAVLALVYGSGNAEIVVNGTLNIDHTTTLFGAPIDSDGLETIARIENIRNAPVKESRISFNGSGIISTAAGNAVLAEVRDGSGNIFVSLKKANGNIVLNTNNEKGHHEPTTIDRVGSSSHGIKAFSENSARIEKTNITIDTDANINILGIRGNGIYIQNGAASGKNEIKNFGEINISNEQNIEGHGIYSAVDRLLSQNAQYVLTSSVENEGAITTSGNKANGIYVSGNGDTTITNNGSIASKYQGIYLSQQSENAKTTLTNNAVIDVSAGVGGINFSTQGIGTIKLGDLSDIRGGKSRGDEKGFGLKLNDGANTITNSGNIASANDLAILSLSDAGSKIINNVGANGARGNITGIITAKAKMDFDNNADFDLRYIDEDGVRHVAVSDFAGGTISNTGTIQFADVSHATSVDNTDEYKTGYGQHVSMNDGALQGHLQGVETFNHSGLIDLTHGNKPGNILRISGVNGALGTFVSNGGRLKLNTVINAGGVNSLSDILVVDNVKLGSKATMIEINKMNEVPSYTQAHGILLVKALGTEIDANAFKLADTVSYGLYDYTLQAITNIEGANGFYLSNVAPPSDICPAAAFSSGNACSGNVPDDPKDKPSGDEPADVKPNEPADVKPNEPADVKPNEPNDESTDSNPPDTAVDVNEESSKGQQIIAASKGKLQYSRVLGQYLGMQYIAAHMFDQNILDRRDNVRKPDETVWGRIEYSETKTGQFNNTQALKAKTTLIQLGWDLFQNEERTNVFGIYGGYGYSDVKNRSKLTGSEAEGHVKGYQIGAYYSWMKQDEVGPYVDVWGHIAKYRNTMTGRAQLDQSKSYNGHGFALSAEVGRGFITGTSDSGNTSWILEPHAQVTYNYLKNNSFIDARGTRFTENKAKGFDTRLGARFYGYREANDTLRPYVELNWLYNGTPNAVDVNDQQVSSRIGRNVGELKVGVQGHVAKDISVSANLGFQKGKNDFKRTEAQVVVNYNL